MPEQQRNFRHLNREGLWPGFATAGLEADGEGVLRLEALPLLTEEPDFDAEALTGPTGVTGVTADEDGSVYAVDGDANVVVRLQDCAGEGGREVVIRSPGGAAGVAVAPHRRSLYVAEPAAGRVRIVDLTNGRANEAWTGLDQPTALAFDGKGALYVVESGSGRLRKLAPTGIEDAAFRTAVAGIAATDVAAITVDGATMVYALDAAAPAIHVVDADGTEAAAPFGQADLKQPLGIAADETRVYVGDNEARRVLTYTRGEHKKAGVAIGYRGPVAGLALAHEGGLLVHTGSATLVARLTRNAGRRAHGDLWSIEPALVGERNRFWGRLKALANHGGGGLQFYWAFGINAPTVDPGSDDPFPATDWLAGPPSVLDLHLGGVEDERIWVGARLTSDGRADPSLEQIRVEYDREGYIEHLPAVYRESPGDQFLARFLTLFETFFEEGQTAIRQLPELFDPWAVPAEALDWLATWLAVELDEDWSDQQRREAVATAYERYARRGTPRGMREEIWRRTGLRAHVVEPLQFAEVWTLPPAPDPCACGGGDPDCDCGCTSVRASVLGRNTMLAPAEPQGAVAGTSAVLDESHVISNEEIGSPLWRDRAHRFTVYLHRGRADCPGRRAEVEAVIASEKPAHTLHQVCTIEPRMRVGYQAIVGLDAVVAGRSPTRLDSNDDEWILGGPPPGRVGASRVGMSTRL